MVERYSVHTFPRRQPFSVIYAILVTNIINIFISQQGEFQCKRILRIRYFKLILLTIQRLAVYDKISKIHLPQFHSVPVDISRIKSRYPISDAETRKIICTMKHGSLDIFMSSQSIAIDMTDKTVFLSDILPDTHCGTYP